MSEAVRLMGADEFLEWCTVQDGRYELVSGLPVAMAGAKQARDLIVVNAVALLGPALRGGPWSGSAAEGLEAVIDLPDLGIHLALRDLYAGLTFRPHPSPIAEQPA